MQEQKDKYYFYIDLLQDLVINKYTGNAANIKALDYIPSSLISGLIIKGVDDLLEPILRGELFISDAHISKAENRTLKVPLNWYVPKYNKNNEIFIYHKLSKKNLLDNQYKQLREGYFYLKDDTLFITLVETDYKISSEYFVEKGVMKEGRMHIKNFICKGQRFAFYLEGTKDNLEKARDYLVKRNYSLGAYLKSYGEVKFTYAEGYCDWIKLNENQEFNIVYMASNHCFLNSFGNYMALPDNNSISFKDSQISHERNYSYNRKRNNWNASRNESVKGSIVCMNDDSKLEDSIFKSEGRGERLYNASFVHEIPEIYTDYEAERTLESRSQNVKINKLNNLLKAVKYNQNLIDSYNVAKSRAFEEASDIKDYSNLPSSSQWNTLYGLVRSKGIECLKVEWESGYFHKRPDWSNLEKDFKLFIENPEIYNKDFWLIFSLTMRKLIVKKNNNH